MNTKTLLSSKAAEYLRERFNATDEEIIMTEIFYQNRYEEDDVTIINFGKYEYNSLEVCDLFDYYLRVKVDQEVIPLTIDQVVTYLLTRFYSCNSGNEYDYNFLFDNLNKSKFANRCYKNNLADNLVKVGRNYYLLEDNYILQRRMNGSLF